ncbi:hypothetical protein [Lysinibacillus telephonicus]|uniref:hypothetical protein n=1 Tax=Lysinibacillus telephonicus TaxID=1714840 RepID=UPI003B9F1F16
MTLSKPLILDQPTLEEKISFVVENFNEIFLKQENRPLFNNKTIYFEVSKEYRGMVHPYPEKLMHILSLEDKGEMAILPCNNDISNLICQNKCRLRNAMLDFQLLQRQECFYRMSRIHWIPEIIKLANNNSPHIKVWEEHTRNKKGKKVTKTFIRYQEGLIDYIIILAHRTKDGLLANYIFETAFPVFYERSKKQYDRSFETNT